MKAVRVSGHDQIQFARTVEVARGGKHHRVRVGALLARGRHTRAKSHNVIHEGIEAEPYYPGHAERRVIAGQPAIKGTLYVARVDLSGKVVASYPCDECMNHIRACSCVSKIVYHDGAVLRKVRL